VEQRDTGQPRLIWECLAATGEERVSVESHERLETEKPGVEVRAFVLIRSRKVVTPMSLSLVIRAGLHFVGWLRLKLTLRKK
jgi:hypothetical protein